MQRSASALSPRPAPSAPTRSRSGSKPGLPDSGAVSPHTCCLPPAEKPEHHWIGSFLSGPGGNRLGTHQARPHTRPLLGSSSLPGVLFPLHPVASRAGDAPQKGFSRPLHGKQPPSSPTLSLRHLLAYPQQLSRSQAILCVDAPRFTVGLLCPHKPW